MMSAGRIGIGLGAVLMFGCAWLALSEFLERERREQSAERSHYRSKWERISAKHIATLAVKELANPEISARIRASENHLKAASEVFRIVGESVMREISGGEPKTSAVRVDADDPNVAEFGINADDFRI